MINILYLIRQTKWTGRCPGVLQVRSKHSACRSQYLHTVKGSITELYKLDTEYDVVCTRKVAYLLEEDRFLCPRDKYDVGSTIFTLVFDPS